MKVKIKAKAKINLSLNIVGEKEGYHLLDSVVTEISLGDILYVESSDKISVTYDNGFCVEEEKDNTIKTIKAFMQEFNVGAVKVFVKKRIPQKAGLGGSSADAVGVAKAMQKIYNIKDNDKVVSLLSKIGADCPVQYYGGYSLMQGKGEIIKKISSKKKLYFVLLCEDNGVDTKECFKMADRLQNNIVSDNEQLIGFLNGNIAKIPILDNALKKPATLLNQEVLKNLQVLQKYFCRYNLTGSGSCCYGLTQNFFKAYKIYKKLKKEGRKVYLCKN